MKCPLKPEKFTEAEGIVRHEYRECWKGECAWWVARSFRCVVQEYALRLHDVALALEKMAAKMPHEG